LLKKLRPQAKKLSSRKNSVGVPFRERSIFWLRPLDLARRELASKLRNFAGKVKLKGATPEMPQS
jgi:hypothetical protein